MGDGDQHDALEAARRIQQLSDQYWHVLDASCTALRDQAWLGPTGRRFADDVYAARRELWKQLTAAVHIARAAERSLQKKR